MAITYNLNYTDLTDIFVNVANVGKLTLNSVTGEFKLVGLDNTTITQQGVTANSGTSMPGYTMYWPTGFNGLFRRADFEMPLPIDSMNQTGQSGTSKWQFEGEVPLTIAQPQPNPQPVPTADIETDANLTSDILRTDPEGKKYYFAKAFTINGTNGITVSTGDQEINLEFDQTLLANFLTSSDITSFLTEAQVQALLTGFLTNADIANFITQEAVQTLVANFLTANDLSSLTNDVITSGVVKGDILKVNTHIEFADGSIIKSVPQV